MSRGVKIAAAELAACSSERLTVREAAQRLGVAPATIWRRRNLLGLQFTARRTKPPFRSIEVVAALREGLDTAPAIALRVGRSTSAVSEMLQRLCDRGIITRGPVALRKTGGRPPIRWRLAPKFGGAQ